ncbi:MAG TPA: PQQ-binding-like beta-propeller repeat protein [Rugosimonospora sp.]|nr:PQQ-binding-like beta-propeller repeat protein [Rugosimonospora sp.]
MKARWACVVVGVLFCALSAVAAPAQAATTGITLSVTAGPPTQVLTVTGAGFAAAEAVDVYLGTTDLALTVAGADGTLNLPGFTIPPSTQPGQAWVTAVGRRSGVAAQAPFLVRTDWPQLGFGPAHKGTNPYENTLTNATVPGIGKRWTSPTGGGADGAVEAGGVVYVGGPAGNLYALDATSGARLWSFPTGDWVDAAPAVAGGVVYVGSGDDNVYALDAATGVKRWSFTTGDSVETAPTVVNGTVYIGSDDGSVYALDATTGARRWAYATGGFVSTAVAVVDGTVYATSVNFSGQGSLLTAVDATTGAKRWSFPVAAMTYYAPAVVNGRVYVNSGSGLYAFSAAGAGQLWSFQGQSFNSSPAVANGVVYAGSVGGDVYAFDAVSGAQLWHVSIARPNQMYSPSVVNGVVYLGGRFTPVFALDAATGTTLWSYDNGFGFNMMTLVANGVLITGSSDGNIYAFDLTGGLNANATPRVDPKTLHPNLALKAR